MLARLVQPQPIRWKVSFIQGLERGTITLSAFGVPRIEKCAQIFWPDWTIKDDLCDRGGNPMYAYLACLTIGSKVCALLAVRKEGGWYVISDVVASFQHCGYGAALLRATLIRIECFDQQSVPGTGRCVIFAHPDNGAARRVYGRMVTSVEDECSDGEAAKWARFRLGTWDVGLAAPSAPGGGIRSMEILEERGDSEEIEVVEGEGCVDEKGVGEEEVEDVAMEEEGVEVEEEGAEGGRGCVEEAGADEVRAVEEEDEAEEEEELETSPPFAPSSHEADIARVKAVMGLPPGTSACDVLREACSRLELPVPDFQNASAVVALSDVVRLASPSQLRNEGRGEAALSQADAARAGRPPKRAWAAVGALAPCTNCLKVFEARMLDKGACSDCCYSSCGESGAECESDATDVDELDGAVRGQTARFMPPTHEGVERGGKSRGKSQSAPPSRFPTPTQREQRASYCGNQSRMGVELRRWALAYANCRCGPHCPATCPCCKGEGESCPHDRGGITSQKVHERLKRHPHLIPEHLRGIDWGVDHVIPNEVGGVSWIDNYYLMPKDANSHFGQNWTHEKRTYVGKNAARQATSFCRWHGRQCARDIHFDSFVYRLEKRLVGRSLR